MTCRWSTPTKPAVSTTSSLLTLSYVWQKGATGDTSACPSGTESAHCGRLSRRYPSSGTSGCWKLSPGQSEQKLCLFYFWPDFITALLQGFCLWQVEPKCAQGDFREKVQQPAGDAVHLCSSVQKRSLSLHWVSSFQLKVKLYLMISLHVVWLWLGP